MFRTDMLRGNEFFNVTGTYGRGRPSSVSEQISIEDFLALVAGGPPRNIFTGSVDTLLPSDNFIQWMSPTALAKTQFIGLGTVPGQEIGICDAQGTAATYPITLRGVGLVTIGGNASLPLSDNFFTIVLKWDGIANWIIMSYYDGSKSGGTPNYLLSDDGQILTDDNGVPLLAS